MNLNQLPGLAIGIGCVLLAGVVAQGFVLVEDGEPRATIVVETLDGFESERLPEGVQDLIVYVERVSGAQLLLAEGEPPEGPIVLVKQIQPTDAMTKDGFELTIGDEGITIAAWHDEGLHNGLIELLDRQGVRWYWPGPTGELVPQHPTIEFDNGSEIVTPDYLTRRGVSAGITADEDWNQTVWKWSRRNRVGGAHWHGSGHSYQYLVPASRYFESHPEYFALMDGERNPANICVSNPEVADVAARTAIGWLRSDKREMVFVSPPDGSAMCECKACEALLVPSTGRSDRVAWFANQVGRRVAREFPDVKMLLYNYHDYVVAPARVKPASNVTSQFALWSSTTGYRHNWPMTDEHNAQAREMFLANAAVYRPIGIRAYYGHYHWFTYWPQVENMIQDLRWWHEQGARYILSESHQHWSTQGRNFYWMYRLGWDLDTDVAAEMDRYYNDFLGPAGPAMRRLDALTLKAFQDRDSVSGASFADAETWTPAFLKRAEALMRQAVAATTAPDVEPIYRERLDLLEKGLRVVRLWTDGLRAKQAFSTSRSSGHRDAAASAFRELYELVSDPAHPALIAAGHNKGRNMVENIKTQLDQIANPGTHFPGRGEVSYIDTLNGGGRASFDALNIEGFITTTYGYSLPAGASGRIEWEFIAREGAFGQTTLAINDPVDRNPGKCQVSISVDGGETFQPLPFERSNDFTRKFNARKLDIDAYVRGHDRFHIRIDAINASGERKLVLDTLMLTGEIQ